MDGMNRCQHLGIDIYNFHPGSTTGKITVEEGLQNIADSINETHAQTNNVVAVLENMCGQKNTIGGDFKELKGIIDRVKDKSRVGVCLDTCHSFAAGYDIATESGYKTFIDDFERIVGFRYLKAIHLNDSMKEVGSHVDRHHNIGLGKLGMEAFSRIVNEPRFKNIPMILETPDSSLYEQEIEMLYKLVKT